MSLATLCAQNIHWEERRMPEKVKRLRPARLDTITESIQDYLDAPLDLTGNQPRREAECYPSGLDCRHFSHPLRHRGDHGPTQALGGGCRHNAGGNIPRLNPAHGD